MSETDPPNHIICTQQLLCAICGNLLTAPIMLISTIGDVCHVCYDRDFKNAGKVIHGEGQDQVIVDVGKQKAAIRNISLEEVMKAIECRCKYSSKGCAFKGDMKTVQGHESVCQFRKITCVLLGCQWKGMEFEYAEHLLMSNHDNSVKCSKPEDLTIFPLDAVEIQEPTEAIYSLNTVSGIILLHFKLNLKQIRCAVFKVEKYYEETYNIELVFKSEKIIVSFECCNVNKIETFKDFYDNEETKFDFNFLPIDSNEPVIVDIRLKHNIYGHIYNFVLPSLCEEENKRLARSCCEFSNAGCCIFLLKDDLSNHVNLCKYRKIWRCLFCDYDNELFPTIRTHLITDHKGKIDFINSNAVEVIFARIEESNKETRTVIAFNMVFVIDYNCNSQSLTFTVCPRGAAFGPTNPLLVEITLLDRKQHKSLVLKRPCINSWEEKFGDLYIEKSFLNRWFSSLENIDFISVKIIFDSKNSVS